MLHPPHQSLQVAAVPPQGVPVRERDQDAPWHTEAVCRRDEAGLFFAPSKEPTAARLSREDAAKHFRPRRSRDLRLALKFSNLFSRQTQVEAGLRHATRECSEPGTVKGIASDYVLMVLMSKAGATAYRGKHIRPAMSLCPQCARLRRRTVQRRNTLATLRH